MAQTRRAPYLRLPVPSWDALSYAGISPLEGSPSSRVSVPGAFPPVLSVGGGYAHRNAPLEIFFNLADYAAMGTARAGTGTSSRWYSMEEIISHFIFFSEGPVMPSGFSNGAVEAPKGHLGVTVVSRGSSKLFRARIRSSIQIMAGHLNALTAGTSLGDFVVVISGSNIVVGEIDR